MPSFNSTLRQWLRSVLLSLPKLPQACVDSSKTMAFIRVWNYLSAAKIKGDYLEFGVFEGTSFTLALRSASKFYAKNSQTRPRFFAFDSFSGLPELHPKRDVKELFHQGEYSAPYEKFKKTIQKASQSWEVVIVPGLFKTSLNPEVCKSHKLSCAAFVTIDCDLYESTHEALTFLTPLLHSGSVLFFDDWFSSKGDMTLGEAGACQDWLKENLDFTLIDYGNVGVMGKLFIVNRRNVDPLGKVC